MIGRMHESEMREVRRVGIPENILSKMYKGEKLTEDEQEIVNKHGKVYVPGFTKARGTIIVNPHIRDMPEISPEKWERMQLHLKDLRSRR